MKKNLVVLKIYYIIVHFEIQSKDIPTYYFKISPSKRPPNIKNIIRKYFLLLVSHQND